MKTLLFYDKEDFYNYRESVENDGYKVHSISRYIKNSYLISEFYDNKLIIDLSVLTEYTSIQYILENVIPEIPDNIVFICDSSKRDKLEYELRLIFDNFSIIDGNIYLKKEENDEKKILSSNINKHHKKITDLTDDELNHFFYEFNNSLYGHSKFKADFEEQVRTFRVFNKIEEHKVLSIFLMGDSGVGKTEVARTIFKCLKGEKRLAKINFGNYSNEYSLSSLIGSARGYIGSEDGEIFMRVRETDIGVLLIDEFEKSNASLFNYFLDVLESGKMISSLGNEIDINGFIIIFTSNISKNDFQKRISPELRSRFDYKCIFTLLGNEDKKKYIEFRVKAISKKVKINEEKLQDFMNKEIDVSLYTNMRDINKRIKKKFIEFISR